MAQALDPVQVRPTKSGAPPVELGWTVISRPIFGSPDQHSADLYVFTKLIFLKLESFSVRPVLKPPILGPILWSRAAPIPREEGVPVGEVVKFWLWSEAYRSISPMTTSSEPTMAGTSAMRHPRQRSLVTDRLQNELLRARARQGIALPSLTR